MAEAQTYSLREIIDFCTHYLPALAGDVRPSESMGAAEISVQMAKIFNGLAAAYPEAGKIYWGCRTWQLWMWQPVFIGVWAASLKNVSVNFNGFSHRMSDLFTERYTIPEQTMKTQALEQSVFQTASHLKSWMMHQLPLIQTHYNMTDKLAAYFLGDAVLKALVVAQRFGLLTVKQTLELEKVWQKALDLRCNGWLVWQDDADEFLVEMTSCCQHFRREGAEYCVGCPKNRQKCGCA